MRRDVAVTTKCRLLRAFDFELTPLAFKSKLCEQTHDHQTNYKSLTTTGIGGHSSRDTT
jgi:hypothetical protein